MIAMAVLCLVSGASYIIPDNICPANLNGSLLYENENPEAARVLPGAETPARNKRVSRNISSGTGITAVPVRTGTAYRQLACWAKPAYYDFLHRFSLF